MSDHEELVKKYQALQVESSRIDSKLETLKEQLSTSKNEIKTSLEKTGCKTLTELDAKASELAESLGTAIEEAQRLMNDVKSGKPVEISSKTLEIKEPDGLIPVEKEEKPTDAGIGAKDVFENAAKKVEEERTPEVEGEIVDDDFDNEQAPDEVLQDPGPDEKACIEEEEHRQDCEFEEKKKFLAPDEDKRTAGIKAELDKVVQGVDTEQESLEDEFDDDDFFGEAEEQSPASKDESGTEGIEDEFDDFD